MFRSSLTTVLLAFGLAACTANVDARGSQIGTGATIGGGKTSAAETTKAKDGIKSVAGSKTPPAGATSKGMQSKPKVGSIEIPIESAEVYVVLLNVDDDAEEEEVYWVASGDYVYVWVSATVDCADGNGSGEELLVYEQHGNEYGWLVAGDGCGWTNAYGCSGTISGPEVCGGCAWDTTAIVCQASASN
jgi:hypothetical protein